MSLDFSQMPRWRVKEYAFHYHYGSYKNRELALASLSRRAAEELAARDGRPCPEPHLWFEA